MSKKIWEFFGKFEVSECFEAHFLVIKLEFSRFGAELPSTRLSMVKNTYLETECDQWES